MHKIDIPSPLSRIQRQVEVRGVVLTRVERCEPECIALMEDANLQMSSLEVIDMLDRGITMILEPESALAWQTLRHPEPQRDSDGNVTGPPLTDPITLHEMTAIGQFFVEAETRLPTTQPSASTTGSDGTKPSSEAPSEPEEALSTV